MNYKIENNINFYAELLNQVYCDNTDKNIESADLNMPKCLINKLPLGINKITLPCSHAFNYSALYKEVYNSKYKQPISRMNRLQRNEIRCPYCRKVHQYILPYIPSEVPDKKIGVNWPAKYALLPSTCKHTFKSGNKKGQQCLKPCLSGESIDLCPRHKKIHEAAAHKASVPRCLVILKNGKRVGQPCGAKCTTNGMCLRHYKKSMNSLES